MNDETSAAIAANVKHTLFTNIAFVQLQGAKLRMDAYAVLLEDRCLSFGPPGYRIRGFGPDAAWPVFTFWLEKGPIVYSVTSAQDNSKVMLKDDGTTEPIFGGSILSIVDGPQFFLQSDNPKRPLDVFTNIGDIEEVWRQLELRVAKYWQMPFMPHSSFGPPADVIERDNARLRAAIRATRNSA